MLIYLACEDRWLDREAVASVFWPDRSPDDARHNLRVNLHRVRQLLAERGFESTLQSERSRVRLNLPTDVGALRAAIAAGNGFALEAYAPMAWLDGFRVAGFAGFFDWSNALGAQLRMEWRKAAEQRLHVQAPDTIGAVWAEALRRKLSTAGDAEGELAEAMPGDATAFTLVGRKQTLHALQQTQFRAMLLTGEAGMGKTSLLLSAFAEVPVLYGREGLTQIPYRAVVEYLQSNMPALRARLKHADDALGAYRLDLARLLPQLAPHEALPPLDMHTAKARLLEALARVFEGLSPWMVVDDLQWCDAASLELLALLTHRGVVRWRAGARAYELTDAQRVWLATLERSGHLHQLALRGLDAGEIHALCKLHRPDRVWHADQVQHLHSLSDGNPFALQELLQFEQSATANGDDATHQLPPTLVRDMIQSRLRVLPPAARSLVEAAAVVGQPMPMGVLAQVADIQPEQHLSATRMALESDLLREATGGLACRHDLVRYAVLASLSSSHQQILHRKAALAMAARAEGEAEPLAVAAHWTAAQEPQTALAWMLRGADQLKRRGQFEEARNLWGRVAQESLDATQGLQARLALAECELLTNLGAGRQALELILEQVPAVADPMQRGPIEAQVLSGLVDNLVFAGDMAAARNHAARLRPLLPGLRSDIRIHACEVLIELAMREPDIAEAWALLAQVKLLAPHNPSTLSFEGQIHWFSGNALAARDAFEALLAQYPAYCSGLTIENDLAVMLFALGDLERAETMARRSLVSWAGVAHTESLSLLVLGSIMTSAGRFEEALDALNQAHQLGVTQGSALFVAEAKVRRARLQLQRGQVNAALQDLDEADAALHGSNDPLRVSQYAVIRLECQIAAGLDPDRTLVKRVQALTERSSHPLMLVRLARMQALVALTDGLHDLAAQAAQRQADMARAAGLLEPLTDALFLLAAVASKDEARERLAEEALELTQRQGFHKTVT